MSLAEFAGPNRLDIAGRAALISSALQSRLVGQDLIFGAGLEVFADEVRPTVLVAREPIAIPPIRSTTLGQLSDVLQLVVSALGAQPEWLSSVGVILLPPPEPYVAAGTSISSPNVGTVGCQASWTGGTGFLTAGHVAPTSGVGVFDGRTRLGTVKFANNPAGSGTAAQADIAVIEFASGLSFMPALGHAVAAGPNASVTVHNSTAPAAVVMAFCNWVYWPSVGGTYGDTYLTTTSVSTGGDSGSAVVDAKTGDVIGLVVGGSAGVTTFIQDIRYQVAQTVSLGGYPD